ncbi:hypothetical protein JCM21900_004725 [Sporobolomyces salmonicolor]
MVDAGYFLPSIPQITLLWACVVLGILYAAFKIHHCFCRVKLQLHILRTVAGDDKLSTCKEMYLNQTYLVPSPPLSSSPLFLPSPSPSPSPTLVSPTR